jgi:translation initiation factor 1
MSHSEYRLVWSSDSGDLRKKEQDRPQVKSLSPNQQTAYLHRDSKGRGGKGMTLIKNLVLAEDDMFALAKKIKQACGTGGTVKSKVIEIQGNDRERIAEILVKMGYKVKIAGG